MSADRNATFRSAFLDTLLFFYTFCLIAYAVPWQTLGYLPGPLDADLFVGHFSKFAFGGLTLGVISLALAGIATLRSWPTLGHALFHASASNRWFYRTHGLALLLASLIVSVHVTDASLRELLNPDGLSGALRLSRGLLDPNFEILPRALALAFETIYISFLATVLAIPLAFALAFLAAKNLMRSRGATAIYLLMRVLLNLTRSVEPLIYALIFTVWVGVGPFAGMLALAVHSVASLIKYYSEIIENIESGPVDAIRSTGASPIQVLWFGVVPQILMPYLAMTVYRWDTNVRTATVIGLVGGGGLGTLLITYQGQALWREVGCLILVIAVIVWIMDTASAYLREALR